MTPRPDVLSGAADVLIRVRDLGKRFGDVVAVDGVDLDVPRGRVLALLGPSGCGKTTMLRLIAGFERPDRGSIEIDGRVVAGDRRLVPAEKRRVGMVFQDYALFPHLTVSRNVGFGLTRGRGQAHARRVAEVLDLVGLGGHGDRHPHELSGGQQQRVALARALAPEPSVVLLDEPFSNLDAALRAQVRADVHRILVEAGTTAVFVTHDQEEALSMADAVAVMQDGRIAQLDAPERLYHAPADRRVAAFVGDAEFLPGRPDGHLVHTELGTLPLLAPAAGSNGHSGHVDVLVRPEDLQVLRDDHGPATVLFREFYGHDQMLFLRLDTGRVLRARLGPVCDLVPGDRCRVAVTGAVQAYPAETGTATA
jgi:iron(III) transport system ATP-binding protein